MKIGVLGAFRALVVCALLVPTTLLAQGRRPTERPSAEEEKAERSDAARRKAFGKIAWVRGPADARLGKVADLAVPAFCRVTDEDGAKLFMEASGNPPSGSEVGILFCDDTKADWAKWFVVFSFDESGFVKDDDQATLDQAAILKMIQRGTEAGNEERRSRGWEEIEILGWARPPFYDAQTHNLTWSIQLRSKTAIRSPLLSPSITINHSVRLLGRGGVMHADLVAGPKQPHAFVSFDSILTEFSFVEGQRYSEWKEGDKVAAFGLTALVAGGAGAAAAKFGLFGKLWKLILGVLLAFKKLIVVAVVGIGGVLAKIFGGRGAQSKEAKAKARPTPAKAAAAQRPPGRPDPYRPYLPPPGPKPVTQPQTGDAPGIS